MKELLDYFRKLGYEQCARCRGFGPNVYDQRCQRCAAKERKDD